MAQDPSQRHLVKRSASHFLAHCLECLSYAFGLPEVGPEYGSAAQRRPSHGRDAHLEALIHGAVVERIHVQHRQLDLVGDQGEVES